MCTKIKLGLYLTISNSKPTEKYFLIDIHKCATMERENRVESPSDFSLHVVTTLDIRISVIQRYPGVYCTDAIFIQS